MVIYHLYPPSLSTIFIHLYHTSTATFGVCSHFPTWDGISLEGADENRIQFSSGDGGNKKNHLKISPRSPQGLSFFSLSHPETLKIPCSIKKSNSMSFYLIVLSHSPSKYHFDQSQIFEFQFKGPFKKCDLFSFLNRKERRRGKGKGKGKFSSPFPKFLKFYHSK